MSMENYIETHARPKYWGRGKKLSFAFGNLILFSFGDFE